MAQPYAAFPLEAGDADQASPTNAPSVKLSGSKCAGDAGRGFVGRIFTEEMAVLREAIAPQRDVARGIARLQAAQDGLRWVGAGRFGSLHRDHGSLANPWQV